MKNLEKGQSLFELVVAIAVSALIIVAVVSLTTNAIRSANFSKNNAIANSLAQDAVEWLRTQRDSDPTTFFTNSDTQFWCFMNLDWNSPGGCSSDALIANLFIREAQFTPDVSGGKSVVHVTVTVYWSDTGATSGTQGTHEVINTTDFADLRQR